VNAATRLKCEPYDCSGAAVAEASALGTAALRPCWPRAPMTAHRPPPLPVRRCSAISRITTPRTVRPGCLACRRRQRPVAGIPRGRSPRFRNARIRRSLIRHGSCCGTPRISPATYPTTARSAPPRRPRSRIFRNRLDVVCLSADPNAAFLPNALGQVGFINPADAIECFDSFTDIPDTAGLSRIYRGIHDRRLAPCLASASPSPAPPSCANDHVGAHKPAFLHKIGTTVRFDREASPAKTFPAGCIAARRSATFAYDSACPPCASPLKPEYPY
jgi:hypothetical protein